MAFETLTRERAAAATRSQPRTARRSGARLDRGCRRRPSTAFSTRLARARSARTQAAGLARLRELGLRTNPHNERCADLDAAVDFYRRLRERRAALDYEIDGVVVKVDELELRERAGATSKFPRWAVAFKYPAQTATTRVRGHRSTVALKASDPRRPCSIPSSWPHQRVARDLTTRTRCGARTCGSQTRCSSRMRGDLRGRQGIPNLRPAERRPSRCPSAARSAVARSEEGAAARYCRAPPLRRSCAAPAYLRGRRWTRGLGRRSSARVESGGSGTSPIYTTMRGLSRPRAHGNSRLRACASRSRHRRPAAPPIDLRYGFRPVERTRGARDEFGSLGDLRAGSGDDSVEDIRPKRRAIVRSPRAGECRALADSASLRCDGVTAQEREARPIIDSRWAYRRLNVSLPALRDEAKRWRMRGGRVAVRQQEDRNSVAGVPGAKRRAPRGGSSSRRETFERMRLPPRRYGSSSRVPFCRRESAQ